LTIARQQESDGRGAALALIGAFAAARVLLAATLGLGIDEAYTVAISRRLSLSYFDHPPLHQWIAHFAALILGENVWVRLPFVALFAGTGWLSFALTRRLFGARAGLVALAALNLTPYFFASAGGWIVPDGPLLFALGAAALVLARLFFAAPEPGAVWRLWLAAGFWLGMAGLSKYSAIFTPLGLVLFMALSARQRRWFAHPAPYAAAALALALVMPVLIWNAQNEWVSFAFQGARGAAAGRLRPWQISAMTLGEIALLSPWIFAPLAWGLGSALRLARGDDRRLFLLCLSAPPILFFSLAPMWGARGLPHWPMPGWFFAFPLMGAAFGDRWADATVWRPRFIGAAASLALIVFVAVWQVQSGWITRQFGLPAGVVDPTLEALDWRKLRESPLFDGAANAPPAFAVSTKWSEGGKIALALGPAIPVLVYSDDPRGMAFLEKSARFVGKDGVIVVPQAKLDQSLQLFRPYFRQLDPPRFLALGRGGADEIALALVPARGLTGPFALPYPRSIETRREASSGSAPPVRTPDE